MSRVQDLRFVVSEGAALQSRFKTYAEFLAALKEVFALLDGKDAESAALRAKYSTQGIRILEAQNEISAAMRKLELARSRA